MTTLSHEPAATVTDKRRSPLQFLVPEMWASLAIAVMWLAVVFTAVWGPDIVNTTIGGTTSSVPSAVVVAFFAFFGTWVVSRHGFRRGLGE